MHYTKDFCVDMALVKSMYDDIEFDVNLARQAFRESSRIFSDTQVNIIVHEIKKAFEKNKSDFILYKSQDDWDTIVRKNLQEFHIKDIKPREVRFGFKNFLKFGSDIHKQLYMEMQGGTYLLYDDFLTSGATTRDGVRYLKSVNDTNKVIVFVLIKQY